MNKQEKFLKRHKGAILVAVGVWLAVLVAVHVWNAASQLNYTLPDVVGTAVFGLCIPFIVTFMLAGLIDSL